MDMEKAIKTMRGMLRVIFGRTTIIIVGVLLQFFMLFGTINWLADYSSLVYYGFVCMGLLVAVHILSTQGNSSFKIAWLIPVLVVPIFGAVFYIFMYNQLETRTMRKRQQRLSSQLEVHQRQNSEILKSMCQESHGEKGLADYLYNVGSFPVYTGNDAKFFPLGEDKFEEMIKQLKSAKEFIFMEYFIICEGYMWRTILDILVEKARQGVDVRVMYDGMCSLALLPYGYYKELNKLGVKSIPFSQIKPALSSYQNNRDHRKILVIDGKVAFTGGINLADEYINKLVRFGHWKDVAIMIEGPAVKSFTLMFLKMWCTANRMDKVPQEDMNRYVHEQYEHDTSGTGYMQDDITSNVRVDDSDKADMMPYLEQNLEQGRMLDVAKGYVIPYNDNPFDNEQVGKQVYLDILNRARRYVHIMTPYLILDDDVILALKYCAKRGIETIIIMPHIPDKVYAYLLARTYYAELIESGVKIYEYTPGFVHAKLFVSDDIRASVGTSNLDFRSLYLHFECNVYLYNNYVVDDIERDYQNTLEKCQLITEEDCKKYPLTKKFAGRCLRFFAPLM